MKKILIVTAALLSAGCASDESCGVRHTPVYEEPQVEVVEPTPAPVATPAPCGCQQQSVVVEPQPCPCAVRPCECARPEPCREIQRPRITETVVPQPRRRCPTDGQAVNCGCGQYKTFEQPAPEPQVYYTQNYTTVRPVYGAAVAPAPRQIVPAMPEAYVLASNRVVSRFFKDSSSIYAKNPSIKLYVKQPRPLSADLPSGMDKGVANFKNQIAASYTFTITDNPSEADYYVETTADWFDTPSKSVPAIQYTTSLFDRNNNKVKEWSEIIKKADRSQSWL
jgi:hypothetical protein